MSLIGSTGRTLVVLPNGSVAQRVLSNGNGSMLEGIIYDEVQATYPDPVTEVYEFTDNIDGGGLVATVTIIYTSASKSTLLSAIRT